MGRTVNDRSESTRLPFVPWVALVVLAARAWSSVIVAFYSLQRRWSLAITIRICLARVASTI